MRDSKVRENRLRRMADRQGLKLRRSPRRDENAIDYGLYALTTHDGGRGTIHPEGPISPFALDLDAVEQLLTPRAHRRRLDQLALEADPEQASRAGSGLRGP